MIVERKALLAMISIETNRDQLIDVFDTFHRKKDKC